MSVGREEEDDEASTKLVETTAPGVPVSHGVGRRRGVCAWMRGPPRGRTERTSDQFGCTLDSTSLGEHRGQPFRRGYRLRSIKTVHGKHERSEGTTTSTG